MLELGANYALLRRAIIATEPSTNRMAEDGSGTLLVTVKVPEPKVGLSKVVGRSIQAIRELEPAFERQLF